MPSHARACSIVLFVAAALARADAAPRAPVTHPPSAQAAAADGATAFAAGDYERALAAYQRAYLEDIDEPQYLLRLADCYRALQRTAEALRFYRLFLHERPHTPERASVEASIAALAHPPPLPMPTSQAQPQPQPTPPAQPTPQVQPTPTPLAASVQADRPAAAAPARPIWRRWWLWTAVGGAAAIGVGLGVGLGTRSSGSGSFAPTLPAFGPGGQSMTVLH